ncbi:hypothetical protein NC651_039597 [Populus alba x Populus x berolinensis]|nr:hypothetical protein NC651_039597 [Populus alba x Populus x berolinensis]
MDPRHHKIPYFVVSSGRKGSDTAVPYLQKLEKDNFPKQDPFSGHQLTEESDGDDGLTFLRQISNKAPLSKCKEN